MVTCSRQIHTLDDLRNYVNETLCNENELEIGAFHFTERILLRGSRACGVFFCLHGPRALRATAIWETDQNTILFYDSRGDRTHKTQLVCAPILEKAAA